MLPVIMMIVLMMMHLSLMGVVVVSKYDNDDECD